MTKQSTIEKLRNATQPTAFQVTLKPSPARSLAALADLKQCDPQDLIAWLIETVESGRPVMTGPARDYAQDPRTTGYRDEALQELARGLREVEEVVADRLEDVSGRLHQLATVVVTLAEAHLRAPQSVNSDGGA